MTRLPLQTLPTFELLAELQNMRAVAQRLHLTHSAVSQQIKLLEEQLGVALFDRRGRGLVLNAAGAALQQAVRPALAQLDQGARQARAVAGTQKQLLRLSVLPSFAQRWLLPRMGRWQAEHPELTLELHSSQRLVDLGREGFHAALRSGQGPWRGLASRQLIDSPLIAVAAPQRAARLRADDPRALAQEPLLGASDTWAQFLAQCGVSLDAKTVADFNDAGLMLQATEADLGVALARELLAADALQAGRLVRVSAHQMRVESAPSYWLVYPPELVDWPPMRSLQAWLVREIEASGSLLTPAR